VGRNYTADDLDKVLNNERPQENCSYEWQGKRYEIPIHGFAMRKAWKLDEAFYTEIESDDIALMKFGSRLLKQVLYGEKTIEEQDGVYEQRLEERKDVIEMRRQFEIQRHQKKEDDKYSKD